MAAPEDNNPSGLFLTPPHPQGSVSLNMPSPGFGGMLLQSRLDANLSVAQAATAAKVRPGTLQKLETGDFAIIDINPYYCLPLIERLCLAYGLSPEEAEAIKDAFDLDLHRYQAKTGMELSRDDLMDSLEKSSSAPRRRISAVLISLLIALLVLLIIGGYLYKSYQQRRLKNDNTDYDLPSLIEPQRLPMDALPIPNS